MVRVSLSSLTGYLLAGVPIDVAGKFTAVVGRIAGFGASGYLRGLRAGERL